MPVGNVCLPTPQAVIDDPRSGSAATAPQIYPQKASRSHHAPPKSGSRPDTTGQSKTHSRRPQRALPGEFCDKVGSSTKNIHHNPRFRIAFVSDNLAAFILTANVLTERETTVNAAFLQGPTNVLHF